MTLASTTLPAQLSLRIALRAGFYAVLDRDDEQLARMLVGAGGARVLQVRLKPASTRDIVRVARMARRVCDEVGARLVVNDRIDIALAVGADGVHLGQTDVPLSDACALVGERLALGISTHDLEQVEQARAANPAYIAYGPIFATTTKQNPDPVQGVAALRAATGVAQGIPVVAIGGIAPGHAPELFAAGATALCAISAVNGAADVAVAARSLGRPGPDMPPTVSYPILRLHPALLHSEDL
jgi:thiamine-phosphate pyrophosphorylase